MIKISSKYEGKHYIHAARKTTFDRVDGGIGWNADQPGFIVIVGETIIDRQLNRFILAETQCNTMGDLLRDAIKLQQRFKLKRWHSVSLPNIERYVDIFNKKQFDKGEQRLLPLDEPLEANDYIQVSIELILDSVQTGSKTLHFFKDSSLPAQLQALPSVTRQLKIHEYPAVAALGYVISYFDEYSKPEPYQYRENAPY